MKIKSKGTYKVGSVYVDAGIVMIGDPCYTLSDDASHRADVAKSWDKFCEAINTHTGIAEPFSTGFGIVIPSGYGDGAYPVYAKYNDEGRITEVKVVFIEENE